MNEHARSSRDNESVCNTGLLCKCKKPRFNLTTCHWISALSKSQSGILDPSNPALVFTRPTIPRSSSWHFQLTRAPARPARTCWFEASNPARLTNFAQHQHTQAYLRLPSPLTTLHLNTHSHLTPNSSFSPTCEEGSIAFKTFILGLEVSCVPVTRYTLCHDGYRRDGFPTPAAD